MKNQILKKIYRAVVYLRLSDEDGDNRESDSISNQRIRIKYLSVKLLQSRIIFLSEIRLPLPMQN